MGMGQIEEGKMENSIRISVKLFYSLFLSLFIGQFAFAESGGVSSKKVSFTFTPEMCRYGKGSLDDIVKENNIRFYRYNPQVLKKKLKDSELVKRIEEHTSNVRNRYQTLDKINKKRDLTDSESAELIHLRNVTRKIDWPGYCLLNGSEEEQVNGFYERIKDGSVGFISFGGSMSLNDIKKYVMFFSKKKLENSLLENCSTHNIRIFCGNPKYSDKNRLVSYSLQNENLEDSLLADVCGKKGVKIEKSQQGCSGGIQGKFNKIITESDKETRENEIKSLEREIDVALEKAKNKKENCTQALDNLLINQRDSQGRNLCFDGFDIFFKNMKGIHSLGVHSFGLDCSEKAVNEYIDKVNSIVQEKITNSFNEIRKQYKMDELCLKRLEAIQNSLAEIKGNSTTTGLAGKVPKRQ